MHAPLPDFTCRLCGATAIEVGQVRGRVHDRDFTLARCPACAFAFVADPSLDYERIYSADYYAGRGADPLVDYVFELEHPDRTVRLYEWRGICRIVSALLSLDEHTRWLDFGCGNGGLVRYARERLGCDAVGFEEGWIAERLAPHGIPALDAAQLEAAAGSFDVVTAIEVLEHVLDPVAELERIAKLLKPGGVLFLTTGNAAPHRDALARWSYVVPDIHISFYEPATLALAMEKAGLVPEDHGFVPGFEDVIKFKLLKNLRVRKRSRLTDAIPATPVARALDRRFRVTAHPVGRLPGASS